MKKLETGYKIIKAILLHIVKIIKKLKQKEKNYFLIKE